MVEVNINYLILLGVGAGTVLLLQFVVAAYLAAAQRVAARQQTELNRELFGLVRRIEALTADRREQILLQFDRILELLAERLPAAVSTRASAAIFEAERSILTRLAELEPNLRNDAESQAKMEGLIRKLESLEQTVVSLTSDAVQQVVIESRNSLFDDIKRGNTLTLPQ